MILKQTNTDVNDNDAVYIRLSMNGSLFILIRLKAHCKTVFSVKFFPQMMRSLTLTPRRNTEWFVETASCKLVKEMSEVL